MYRFAEKSFYTLSAVVLGSAFFVMQPTHNSDAAFFKTQIQNEFKVAALQVFGDQPMFDSVSLVISSVNEFYQRSADAMLAVLTPPASEDGLTQVAQSVYREFQLALNKQSFAEVAASEPETMIPVNFMQEEPVYNIVPFVASQPEEIFQSTVSSAHVDFAPAVNDTGYPWVNLRDNMTGQVYCVAIYNTEVNRYLGSCKYDRYH